MRLDTVSFGMQRHQLDHMQTICTSLQTDNHTNTSSFNFYRPDALPNAQPTVSKHWRHNNNINYNNIKKQQQLNIYCGIKTTHFNIYTLWKVTFLMGIVTWSCVWHTLMIPYTAVSVNAARELEDYVVIMNKNFLIKDTINKK